MKPRVLVTPQGKPRTFLITAIVIIAVWKFCFRFFTGRDLLHPANRRPTNATMFSRGTKRFPGHEADRLTFWAFMPEYQRAIVRLGVVALLFVGTWAFFVLPVLFAVVSWTVLAILVIGGVRRYRYWWRNRAFRRVYLKPLSQAATQVLNIPPHYAIRKWISISPELEGLLPDLVKPMSMRQRKIRRWYGTYLAPTLCYVPERATRLWWWLSGRWPNITRAWSLVKQEGTPHAKVRCPSGYINPDAMKALNHVIGSKLGIGDMVTSTSQVGPDAIVTYTIKQRPPNSVTLADIVKAADECKEYEFVVGLTTKSAPVVFSLEDDSPHIACSAGSGAGKSVLAMIIGIQVLRKGGKVYIIDRKGSHRWARDLPGVVYCTTPAKMHDALIYLSELADDRNTRAIKEAEGWDPGPRHFVIFEEMNATVAQLKAYWDTIRQQGESKLSPAIQAFRNLMYMGRSAKCNLFGVAQMMTANTTGGPEARENFGVRCLARYTGNNWKMLVPQCAMPRKSSTRGRWQIVIGDNVIETQVAFATAMEARDFAQWERNATVEPQPIPDHISLREAIQLGIVGTGWTIEMLRNVRARSKEGFPSSTGNRGPEKLYATDDLRLWAEERKVAA